MSTASVVGISIGAIIGGQIISHGRRRSVLVYNLVSIVGSLLSLVANLPVMCIGRLIFGFATGVLVTACPKIIEETVPAHYMDYWYGTSTNLGINVLVMVNLLAGLLLPSPSDIESLKTTEIWRVIYFFPIPLSCLAIMLTLFVHKYDSLHFLVEQGQ